METNKTLSEDTAQKENILTKFTEVAIYIHKLFTIYPKKEIDITEEVFINQEHRLNCAVNLVDNNFLREIGILVDSLQSTTQNIHDSLKSEISVLEGDEKEIAEFVIEILSKGSNIQVFTNLVAEFGEGFACRIWEALGQEKINNSTLQNLNVDVGELDRTAQIKMAHFFKWQSINKRVIVYIETLSLISEMLDKHPIFKDLREEAILLNKLVDGTDNNIT